MSIRRARTYRRLIGVFTERLGYKAVAIFLALALWLYTHLAVPTASP